MILLAFLAACTSPDPDPRGEQAVIDALTATTQPLETRLARCARAVDPDLAGDCALAVVTPAVRADPTAADLRCPQVPAGVWRSECFFVAAESWYAAGNPLAAARQCRAAVHFPADCAQHLYQAEVRAVVRDGVGAGVAAWPETLPAATTLHETWRTRLGPEVALDERFWGLFYEQSFRHSPDAPVSACEAAPTDHQDLCRRQHARAPGRQEGDVVPE